MKSSPLLIRDLVLLHDMCLERELRCDQRAAEAEGRGDLAQADYERRLKERFSATKTRFWDYVMEGVEMPAEVCSSDAGGALSGGKRSETPVT